MAGPEDQQQGRHRGQPQPNPRRNDRDRFATQVKLDEHQSRKQPTDNRSGDVERSEEPQQPGARNRSADQAFGSSLRMIGWRSHSSRNPSKVKIVAPTAPKSARMGDGADRTRGREGDSRV